MKPSVSVLIIAHNEEENIARCIESVLAQTHSADEVVLVVHNSSDQTQKIAESYAVRTVPYIGPEGITFARLKGLEEVSKDIVLCIDGDSYAAPNWIEELSSALERRGNILVGSRVYWRGNLYARLFNMHRYIGTRFDQDAASWIWGPSFGFWFRDLEQARRIFEASKTLSHELGLTRNPDDYWLALHMSSIGPIEFTDRTWVVANTKERSWLQALKRNVENNKNAERMLEYARKQGNLI
jgi:glycosyltransferase involved in cell wall biosynthesis